MHHPHSIERIHHLAAQGVLFLAFSFPAFLRSTCLESNVTQPAVGQGQHIDLISNEKEMG
jgi:hypothetical protein